MDIFTIFRESWRITLRSWRLWALMAAINLTFLPAMILTVGLGALAGLATLPQDLLAGQFYNTFLSVLNFSKKAWGLVFVVGLVILVTAMILSWILQAGAMRMISRLAEGWSPGLREALTLGRRRVASIFKLAMLFGLLIGFLSLLPALLFLLMPNAQGRQLVMSLQAGGLTPLSSILGIVLLLWMMSLALEDVNTGEAMRLSWQVFKRGWWGFLIVFIVTLVGGVVMALLGIPLGIAVLLAAAFHAWQVFLFIAGFYLPVISVAGLFLGIYTLAMYTLVYKGSISDKVIREQATWTSSE